MAVTEAEPRRGHATQVRGRHQHLPLLQDKGKRLVATHPIAEYGSNEIRVEAMRKGGHAAHIRHPAVMSNDQPIARRGVLRDIETSTISGGADAERATEDRLARCTRAAKRDVAYQRWPQPICIQHEAVCIRAALD